ncbi:flagellar biosynthesis anti-sigma factor FlgM [Tepidibacillus infernus]|uniref:flagellar biosynthesis anti-sigma factor FlgM n=1 Tax=Tepidibacillus infernus TaxID=1806172 RepID=UPI003B73F6C0
MKINDINRIQGISRYQQQINQKERQLKKTESKKDEINISDEAKALLEQTKDVGREEKINQIKDQIKNGTYQVDSGKVAEKILKLFK